MRIQATFDERWLPRTGLLDSQERLIVILYVFDPEDPIIAAYRRIFPSLFKDAAMMPPGLRKHMRYPEMLLKLQAE
ncbi:MAG TPA: UPF0182 family protein, partial [Verrucomicrobiae bacterium]|nr:UPF0182 family protein [Verrucomicrobiae bacterium]